MIQTDQFFSNANQFSYCIQNSGDKFHTDIDQGIDAHCKSYPGMHCSDGDKVTLILDLLKATLCFEKNGISIPVCYDNIVRKEEVKYQLGLAVYQNESVEILDYSEINI